MSFSLRSSATFFRAYLQASPRKLWHSARTKDVLMLSHPHTSWRDAIVGPEPVLLRALEESGCVRPNCLCCQISLSCISWEAQRETQDSPGHARKRWSRNGIEPSEHLIFDSDQHSYSATRAQVRLLGPALKSLPTCCCNWTGPILLLHAEILFCILDVPSWVLALGFLQFRRLVEKCDICHVDVFQCHCSKKKTPKYRAWSVLTGCIKNKNCNKKKHDEAYGSTFAWDTKTVLQFLAMGVLLLLLSEMLIQKTAWNYNRRRLIGIWKHFFLIGKCSSMSSIATAFFYRIQAKKSLQKSLAYKQQMMRELFHM